MKRINALLRKKDHQGLLGLGLSEDQIKELYTPDCFGNIGFARYSFQSYSSEVARLKERISTIEKTSSRKNKEIKGHNYTYREDIQENRILFEFSQKPDPVCREKLKSHGFLWSPTRCAWVRKISNSALYAGHSLREWLDSQ